MMGSLFSSFDPASSLALSSNWVSLVVFLVFVPRTKWVKMSSMLAIGQDMKMFFHREMKLLSASGYAPGSSAIFLALLIVILGSNFLGLFPYVFTATSHILVTLSLALPLWICYMLYGWLNHTKHMMAHLVPLGTPGALMSFMVLIESVSNVIRPITLSVRLAANMIAGHLLLTLLGNQGVGAGYGVVLVVVSSQFLLLTLEAAVAMIQSYVFMTLSVLYSSETS